MTLNWTARYIADWADVRPEPAGIEQEQAYLAGAGEFAQLDTPLEFASLYVTAKCHLQCVHCHAEESFEGTGPAGDVTTSTLLDVIYRLGQVARRIQLTGGEIFVRRDPGTGKNDVPLLVRAISALHREPILQTTGIGLTPESTAFYARHGVKWVALSLDGPNPALNAVIRGRASAFASTLKAVDLCKQAGISVKVGTVVTRLSLDRAAFFELGDLLEKRGVDVWKLMHFYPREAGRASAANADALAIEPGQFRSLLGALRERYAGSEMAIAGHDLDTFRNSPALLVQPAGIVTITKGNSDIPLGNLLTMSRPQMLTAFLGTAPAINENLRNTYRERRLCGHRESRYLPR
jgi:MoaA/NifB/PqqE/SkfB family radical SAM enzyme